jgi:hypothetical protein
MAQDWDVWQRSLGIMNTRQEPFNLFTSDIFPALAAIGGATGLAGAMGAFSGAPAAAGLGAGYPLAEGAAGPALMAAGDVTAPILAGAGAAGGVGAGAAGAAAGGGAAMGGLGFWGPIIAAGIQGGTSLLGGFLGSNAAGNAAATQAQAAREANALLAAIYGQQRQDIEPWRQAGIGALGQLQALTQTPMPTSTYSPVAPLNADPYAFPLEPYAFNSAPYAWNAGSPATPYTPTGMPQAGAGTSPMPLGMGNADLTPLAQGSIVGGNLGWNPGTWEGVVPKSMGQADISSQAGLWDTPAPVGISPGQRQAGLWDTPASVGIPPGQRQAGVWDTPAPVGIPLGQRTLPVSAPNGMSVAPAGISPAGTDPYAFRSPVGVFDPATTAWSPTAALSPAGYAFEPPTGTELLAQDPGYQFRLEQGRQALEASAAARGGLLSGSTGQALSQYGQDLASQEYANAYQRALAENQLAYQRALQENADIYGRDLTGNQLNYARLYQQNQDIYGRALGENELAYGRGLTANQLGYNRALAENQMAFERAWQGNQTGYNRALQQNQDAYQRQLQEYLLNYNQQMGQRQQRWNELSGLAGTGQTAAQQLAALGRQFGSQQAGNITSAGAAQAAGQMGGANAWMQALGGLGGAANSYLGNTLLQQLMQRYPSGGLSYAGG